MTEYDNTNSGTLFKNDMEGKSDKFPPYGGSINVEGVDYWISAWVKEGKKGKFFSLAVKPKEEKPATGNTSSGRRQAPVTTDGFEDTEIPF